MTDFFVCPSSPSQARQIFKSICLKIKVMKRLKNDGYDEDFIKDIEVSKRNRVMLQDIDI